MKTKIIKGSEYLGKNRCVFSINGNMYTGTIYGIDDKVHIRTKAHKHELLFEKNNTFMESNKSFPVLENNQCFILNANTQFSNQVSAIAKKTPNLYWEPNFDIFN